MRSFPNGGLLIENASELPRFSVVHTLFLDTETTSGDPTKTSLNPWFDCRIAGVAVTHDDEPRAWYVPFSLPRDAVIAWLRDVTGRARRWVNHNVKYDYHVVANDAGIEFDGELCDTVTLAKIVDSDRYVYGLDKLSKDWLHEDVSSYELALKPYLYRNKDYGLIPADVIAPYACQDVLTNRRLWRFICARRPEDSADVWDTEVALTRVLIDIEREGMRIDPRRLRIKELETMLLMGMIEERLAKRVGFSFRPHVNDDCYEVLCNKYGLPVLGRTEEGNPSFDKHAMALYASHPLAPADVVGDMMAYRHLNTLLSFFVRPYQELNIDGVLHPSYNQAVRTARLSCSEPNMQQLSADAKELILPGAGNAFMSIDYSQIEFRVIIHYIKNAACTDAYNADPDTDFHQWVADMIPVQRRPAKTINFMMGYGGGREKCVKVLSVNADVVGDVKSRVEVLIAENKIKPDDASRAFSRLCRMKAEATYNKYHDTLPELKATSHLAARALRARGYVRNWYGRHRRLPVEAAHKAFNSLCQSTAADLMKERTVAVWQMLRGTPLRMVANVHDEALFVGPIEAIQDLRTARDLAALMEQPARPLRVPIRCAVGTSDKNWLRASKSAVAVDVGGAGTLEHLR